MLDLNKIMSDVEGAVETQSVDMTETNTASVELLPAGIYNARLMDYIETGKHAVTFGKVVKAPTNQIRLGFQLYNTDGSDAKRMLSFNMGLSNSDKSNTKAIFEGFRKVMPVINGKEFKHFAMALGQPISVAVEIYSKDDKKYNRLNYSTINAPIKFSPDTGEAYKLPPLDPANIRYLLWDNPSMNQWDSIFIDGIREDGVSKNFLQEECLKAHNFSGSPLDLLLNGGEIPIPDTTDDESLKSPESPESTTSNG